MATNHETRRKEITDRLAIIRRMTTVRQALKITREELARRTRTSEDFIRRMEGGDPVDVWDPKIFDVASVLGLRIRAGEKIEPRRP